MQAIHAIVYCSSAVRLLDEAEINQILEQARIRNVAEGITDVLLYSEGCFMQYIEGPYEPLVRVYQSIKDSPLHKNLIELAISAIAAREFGHWAMAYRVASFMLNSIFHVCSSCFTNTLAFVGPISPISLSHQKNS